MKIYHGTIITCDSDDRICSYLVENQGRIAFVGDRLPEMYSHLPVTELLDKSLVPAFADTHTHFSSFALFHSGIHLGEFRSNREILAYLAEAHEDAPDEILIGFGLSPHSVEEGRLITREELDRSVPRYPAFLVNYDGHSCILNSVLLERLPETMKELRGFDGRTGLMGQEAFFRIVDYITGSVSPVRIIHNMYHAYEYMASQGFGLFHSVSGVGYPRDLDVDLERWIGRGIRSSVQSRIFFQTMDIGKVRRRGLPRIGGCFTTALDGCFGSQDAALYDPYEKGDNRGILFYSDEEVRNFCIRANRKGLQIQMHAIGDAAFDQAALALEAALKDYHREDHRHGIIHACLPTERGMDICGENNIQIPVQPAFLNWPQEPGSYLKEILGDRERRLNPLRTLWDRGILLSGGSDAPVTYPDAIRGIHNACNHPEQSESLSVREALKLFTINGYKASFDEDDAGSLEQGKRADMTILSANPLAIPEENLKTLSVESLLLKGKKSLPVKERPFLTIARGIVSRRKV